MRKNNGQEIVIGFIPGVIRVGILPDFLHTGSGCSPMMSVGNI